MPSKQAHIARPKQSIAALEKQVRATADKMRLNLWEFEIAIAPSDDEGAARISAIGCRKYARIEFHDTFFELPAAKQNHVIVHELTHLHLYDMMTMVESLEPILGKAAFDLFVAGFVEANERATDEIAKIISAL